MTDNNKKIDQAYEELKKDGHVTVENVVKWMKDAQILEIVQKSEEEALTLFKDMEKEQAVSKQEFLDVVEDLLKVNAEVLVQMKELQVATSAILSEELEEAAAASSARAKKQKDTECVLM